MVTLICSAASVLGTLPAALPSWVTPPPADWPVLTALGLCGVAAQILSKATVGLLAPLDLPAVPAMVSAATVGEMIRRPAATRTETRTGEPAGGYATL